MSNSPSRHIRGFVAPFGLGVAALSIVQYASAPSAHAQYAPAGVQAAGPAAPVGAAPVVATRPPTSTAGSAASTASNLSTQLANTFGGERKAGLAQSASAPTMEATVGLPNVKFGAPAEPTIRLSARMPYAKGGGSLAIRSETSSLRTGGNEFLGAISGVYWDTANDVILNGLRVLGGAVDHEHRLEVSVDRKPKRMYWVRCDFAKGANEDPTLITVDNGKGQSLGADRSIASVGSADAVLVNPTTVADSAVAYFRIKGNSNVAISACRVAAYQLPPR